MEDKNLDIIFEEIKNQFKYSSNLYDTLESKTNTILVALTLMFTILFNSYFLNQLDKMPLIFTIFHHFSIFTLFLPFVLLMNLRAIKFRLIKLDSLVESYKKGTKKDFRKTLTTKYLEIIEENFKKYRNKNNTYVWISTIMRLGFICATISIISIQMYRYLI